METLAKALKESNSSSSSPHLFLRIQDLTDSVESLSHEVRTLKETQDFDRKLLGSAPREGEKPA